MARVDRVGNTTPIRRASIGAPRPRRGEARRLDHGEGDRCQCSTQCCATTSHDGFVRSNSWRDRKKNRASRLGAFENGRCRRGSAVGERSSSQRGGGTPGSTPTTDNHRSSARRLRVEPTRMSTLAKHFSPGSYERCNPSVTGSSPSGVLASSTVDWRDWVSVASLDRSLLSTRERLRGSAGYPRPSTNDNAIVESFCSSAGVIP